MGVEPRDLEFEVPGLGPCLLEGRVGRGGALPCRLPRASMPRPLHAVVIAMVFHIMPFNIMCLTVFLRVGCDVSCATDMAALADSGWPSAASQHI